MNKLVSNCSRKNKQINDPKWVFSPKCIFTQTGLEMKSLTKGGPKTCLRPYIHIIISPVWEEKWPLTNMHLIWVQFSSCLVPLRSPWIFAYNLITFRLQKSRSRGKDEKLRQEKATMRKKTKHRSMNPPPPPSEFFFFFPSGSFYYKIGRKSKLWSFFDPLIEVMAEYSYSSSKNVHKAHLSIHTRPKPRQQTFPRHKWNGKFFVACRWIFSAYIALQLDTCPL